MYKKKMNVLKNSFKDVSSFIDRQSRNKISVRELKKGNYSRILIQQGCAEIQGA